MKTVNSLMYAFVIVATFSALMVCMMPIAYFIMPPAYAADGQVVVPWGDWISVILTTLQSVPIASIVAAWLVFVMVKAGLPQGIADIIKVSLTDQVLNKAIQFAINAVSGATQGKKLEIHVANQVVEEAADYVIANGPAWIVDWLGGVDAIKKRILARIELVPEAKITSDNVVTTPGH